MPSTENTLLTLQELVCSTGGKCISKSAKGFDDARFCFVSVATDSRDVKEKTLFVPLIGEKQDGHIYISAAIKAGASAVFVTEAVCKEREAEYKTLAEENPSCAFIVVENNMKALQDAAAAYVEKFPQLVKIGITGSSGKTSTKEILVSILAQKYSVVCNEGNFNSETGLPLSVFKIRSENEIGVFELGMNRENEIAEIARVLKPNNAIITNIGTAHIGILKTREKIAEEKKGVFEYISTGGTALVPCGDFADFLSAGVKGEVLRVGKDCAADFGVRFVASEGVFGSRISIDGVETVLPLVGEYNYENALFCIALAKKIGLGAEEIARGIESVRLIDGRSRILQIEVPSSIDEDGGAMKKIMVMYDCYNANPDSMEKAIEFCSSLGLSDGQKKKIFVLGDMKELGSYSREEHERIGRIVCKSGASLAVFVGSEMQAAANLCQNSCAVDFFSDAEEGNLQGICACILGNVDEGDLVLLKASHSMGFDRILDCLKSGAAQLFAQGVLHGRI